MNSIALPPNKTWLQHDLRSYLHYSLRNRDDGFFYSFHHCNLIYFEMMQETLPYASEIAPHPDNSIYMRIEVKLKEPIIHD